MSKLDLPVITFDVFDGGDSILKTSTNLPDLSIATDLAAENNIAFLLPTSGTTSTPKVVAIYHSSQRKINQ